MATFQCFEDTGAWQKSRELTREIYRISKQGPFSKDFGLCDQIRRASISIMSNIAEGFERSGAGEFMQFLSMAKGSVGEVKSQLYAAVDQGYLDKKTFDRLFTLASEISKMIGGLMAYIRDSKIKGIKYKKIVSS
jgi:four helix bundle protein